MEHWFWWGLSWYSVQDVPRDSCLHCLMEWKKTREVMIFSVWFERNWCLDKRQIELYLRDLLDLLLHCLWPPVDIDECRGGTHQCRYNQICENTRGSYHCTCPRGYRSQGVGRPCVGMCIPYSARIPSAPHKHNIIFYDIQGASFAVFRQLLLPFGSA